MKNSSALTISITSYNYSHCLPRAIESVLAQDYDDYELLILDDGSTDDSPAIIAEYAAKHSHIRPIYRQKNLGLMITIEECLSFAKGIYLYFLSADDYLLPDFLSKTMHFLLKHPDIGLCCSDTKYFHIENNEKTLFCRLLKQQTHATTFSPEELILLFRKKNFWIPGHTSIVKKECIYKYGKFNPKLDYLCDWFLLHTIALKEGIGYIPEFLAVICIDLNSYSLKKRSDKKFRESLYWIIFDLLSKKENQELRTLFKKSCLLKFIFKDAFWRLFFYVKFLDFWIYIIASKSSFIEVIKSMARRILRGRPSHG